MTKNMESQSRFIQEIEKASSTIVAQSNDWIKEIRQDNLTRLNKSGLPTIKDEDWKYTNLQPIIEMSPTIIKQGTLLEIEAFKNYVASDKIVAVFVNNVFATELSSLTKIPSGIKFLTLNEAYKSKTFGLKELLTKYGIDHETSFVALNKALSQDGAFIYVDAKTVCQEPIHIVHVTSTKSSGSMSLPRSIIVLNKSSEVTVLESYVGFNDDISYLTNALTDIFIDENATLHYIKVQKESMKSYHVGNTRVWHKANSNFQGFSLSIGAQLTRNDLDVVLNGEGITTTINGMYCINGTQHVDNHTSVDHQQPNCQSNQLYKGILNGASRAVFNGKIFVREIAQKTNSYQLNKNLLLGKDARVDTKPQLEIHADDVKCTHGATIGQMNPDEIFYLRSRCISKSDAQRMLAQGFVDDILSTIHNENIRAKLSQLLEPSLNQI